MIEDVMAFAVGALAAILLACLAAPLVARRGRRAALAELQRRMPMSMAEIAAERDALRAGYAVDRCRLEQQVAAMERRVAHAMGEAGRQSGRLVALDEQATTLRARVESLVAALGVAEAEAATGAATVAEQAQTLASAAAAALERDVALRAAQARVAALETSMVEQNKTLTELRSRLPASDPSEAPAAVPVAAARDGEEQTALVRLRAEQELTRKALGGATAERDRLRLRVDELLLKIEELEDRSEEVAEEADQRQRHAARQAKAIETLTVRLNARDEALAAARQRLAASDPGAAAPALLRDEATLRQAIADLAGDLVAYATTPPALPAGAAGEAAGPAALS